MFSPIENKPRIEKVLNILQLLDGIFDLLKKISWRILSFFIVYLALVGYTALENPMSLREMVRSPDFSKDYFMIGVCLVFIVESVKIIAAKIPMECCAGIACLSFISLFSIMAGYSQENLGVMVLIYLSAAVLEWGCGSVIRILFYKRNERQITEGRTEIRNVKKGIENGNDISRS